MMKELLGRDDVEVVSVLKALNNERVLDAILETSRKNVFHLIASVVGMQLDLDGLIVTKVLENIQNGVFDAVVVQTAMSGRVPTVCPYDGAFSIVRGCGRYDVPAFLVREASVPQRRLEWRTVLEECGGIALENAFSGEIGRLVKIIHAALHSTADVCVVKSAVYAYFEQTEYPPEGWEVQPSRMVRV